MSECTRAIRLVSSLAILASAGCSSSEDIYHPRTALNIARVASGLRIPDSARVLRFSDSFVVKPTNIVQTQGGYWIELQVDSASMQRLLQEADSLGYHRMDDRDSDSIVLASRTRRAGLRGRYKLTLGETTHQNEQFVLLDSALGKVVVTRSRISGSW